MVRLKVEIGKDLSNSTTIFQFLNGAIKRENNQVDVIMNSIFQFLNGAIKSFHLGKQYLALIIFQFLNGAIKRSHAISHIDLIINFNSSMVRLKGSWCKKGYCPEQISIPQWCD